MFKLLYNRFENWSEMTGLTLSGSRTPHTSIFFSIGIGLMLAATVLIASILWFGYAHAANVNPPLLQTPMDGAVIAGTPRQEWSVQDESRVSYYIYESFSDRELKNRIYTETVSSRARKVLNNPTIEIWWRITTVNKDGSRGVSEARRLYIDNTAPVATIAIGSAGQGPYSGTVSVTGKVADQEKNLATSQYEIKNPDNTTAQAGPVVAAGNSHTFTLDTSHGDGDYVVTYTATDKAGNVSAPATATIKVDNTAPEAPLLNGDAIRSMKSGNLLRSWRKSSSNDVKTYQYRSFYTKQDAAERPDVATPRYTYSTPAVAGQENYNLNGETGTQERTLWYRVAAIDYAGNKSWSNEIYEVTIDNTAPSAPLVNTLASPTRDATTTTVEWNKPSDDTTRYKVQYWREGGAVRDVETTSTQQADVFSDGDGIYHVRVQAIDRAGNVSAWSEDVVVTLDTTPPVLSASTGEWDQNKIKVQAVTAEQGVSYTWSAPQGVQISDVKIANPTITVPADTTATYTLQVVVRDAAGNETKQSIDITYSTEPAVQPPVADGETAPSAPASPTQNPAPASQSKPPVALAPQQTAVPARTLPVVNQVPEQDTASVDAPLRADVAQGQPGTGNDPQDLQSQKQKVLGTSTKLDVRDSTLYWLWGVLCITIAAAWWIVAVVRGVLQKERSV